MYSDKMVTTDARQISVTKVDKGSPADGVLEVGDVLLGVGGKPFSHDPRTEFGKALTAAESEAGAGNLVADPLAGRQAGERDFETARARHLQRHRSLRLPEVEAHPGAGLRGFGEDHRRSVLPPEYDPALSQRPGPARQR